MLPRIIFVHTGSRGHVTSISLLCSNHDFYTTTFFANLYKMADSRTLKKRKFSKGKKKNWRKFTDVRDVESYLEDKSREERTG